MDKETAGLFIWFMKYRNIWLRIFKIRGGKAILHFDKDSRLRQVDIDEIVYKL